MDLEPASEKQNPARTGGNRSQLAFWIILGLSLYALSPPFLYKLCDSFGLPLSERAFLTIYAPLVPLVEHFPPYAHLISLEAELLRLD